MFEVLAELLQTELKKLYGRSPSEVGLRLFCSDQLMKII